MKDNTGTCEIDYLRGYAEGLISGWSKSQEKEAQDINNLYPKIFQSIMTELSENVPHAYNKDKIARNKYLEHMSYVVDKGISRVARGKVNTQERSES